MSELYIDKGVHCQILRPSQGHWIYNLWTTKLPSIHDSEKIIFRPSDLPEHSKVLGSCFRHHAKHGYVGIQLQDRSVLLVKEADVSDVVPEDFEDLLIEAEDELEQAQAELAYSPFR